MLLGCYYVDVKVFRVFSTCYYAVAKVVAIWLLRSLECFNMLLCSCKCILWQELFCMLLRCCNVVLMGV